MKRRPRIPEPLSPEPAWEDVPGMYFLGHYRWHRRPWDLWVQRTAWTAAYYALGSRKGLAGRYGEDYQWEVHANIAAYPERWGSDEPVVEAWRRARAKKLTPEMLAARDRETFKKVLDVRFRKSMAEPWPTLPNPPGRSLTWDDVWAHIDRYNRYRGTARDAGWAIPRDILAFDLWTPEAVSLALIEPVSPHAAGDVRRYARMASRKRRPTPFPAVVLLDRGGEGLEVLDGAHRVAAARNLGHGTIMAYVGRRADASRQNPRKRVPASASGGYKLTSRARTLEGVYEALLREKVPREALLHALSKTLEAVARYVREREGSERESVELGISQLAYAAQGERNKEWETEVTAMLLEDRRLDTLDHNARFARREAHSKYTFDPPIVYLTDAVIYARFLLVNPVEWNNGVYDALRSMSATLLAVREPDRAARAFVVTHFTAYLAEAPMRPNPRRRASAPPQRPPGELPKALALEEIYRDRRHPTHRHGASGTGRGRVQQRV